MALCGVSGRPSPVASLVGSLVRTPPRLEAGACVCPGRGAPPAGPFVIVLGSSWAPGARADALRSPVRSKAWPELPPCAAFLGGSRAEPLSCLQGGWRSPGQVGAGSSSLLGPQRGALGGPPCPGPTCTPPSIRSCAWALGRVPSILPLCRGAGVCAGLRGPWHAWSPLSLIPRRRPGGRQDQEEEGREARAQQGGRSPCTWLTWHPTGTRRPCQERPPQLLTWAWPGALGKGRHSGGLTC